MQQINRLKDNDYQQENEDDVDISSTDHISDDLISIASHGTDSSSAFLEE